MVTMVMLIVFTKHSLIGAVEQIVVMFLSSGHLVPAFQSHHEITSLCKHFIGRSEEYHGSYTPQ